MTNQELAQALVDLRDFLVIAGYEESHATRYGHIARYVERMPEDVNVLKREHRLTEIPGVGKLVAVYIKELLEEGRCSKHDEWEKFAPLSVVELVRVPGLGVHRARQLFHEYDIASLAALHAAIDAGHLEHLGVGQAMLDRWREFQLPPVQSG